MASVASDNMSKPLLTLPPPTDITVETSKENILDYFTTVNIVNAETSVSSITA